MTRYASIERKLNVDVVCLLLMSDDPLMMP